MEKLSREDEQRILSALESAVQLTNGGSTPNDALYKVAVDNRFTPPVVQRMVEAYNVSKTLSHIKHAKGPDRAASFPLADAADILERMYPAAPISQAEKSAALFEPEAYDRPDQNFLTRRDPIPMVKQASRTAAYPRDPNAAAHRLANRRLDLRKTANRTGSDYRNHWYRLLDLTKEASGYFRQIPHDSFESVQVKMIGQYGDVGRQMTDLVYELGNLKEKKAAQTDHRRLFYDPGKAPYRQIEQAIKVAYDLVEAAEAAAKAQTELDAYEKQAGLALPGQPEPEGCLLDSVMGGASVPFEEAAGIEKEGILGSLPAALTGGMAALGLSNPDSEGVKQKALSDVYDPIHEATLKGIQTKAMLNDLISNDEIISGYDANEVLTAYNQLAKLSPNVAQQPAVMRGLLRRMLQQEGVVEPHEAQQLAGVENALRQSMPNQ